MDMKNKRIELQKKLEELLASRNVYYQPPESVKMEYPAIRYSKIDIDSAYADNLKYNKRDVYNIVVIDKKPDNPVINKILELPYSDFDGHYISDNLNHDRIKLYY